ncbi:hypothetical protein [Dyadobacter arcticus]|uniref:Lipoprotein n=1 Tax=Dyadobacter arcticus TaxID=1078754 RepID=A0ABX0ULW5_9BACT|nr:hypothetical protein [Dyadobacter arcticus]NIJ53989.1 hypothetical protein [Dyadobacter arcticus]
MRQTYKLVVLMVTAVTLSVATCEHKSNAPDLKADRHSTVTKSPVKGADPTNIPESTVSQLQQGLEKREYHISYDEKKHSLQSPNRKQNLRAYYEPGKLTVQNRIDSAGHNFKLQLINEGILRTAISYTFRSPKLKSIR